MPTLGCSLKNVYLCRDFLPSVSDLQDILTSMFITIISDFNRRNEKGMIQRHNNETLDNEE